MMVPAPWAIRSGAQTHAPLDAIGALTVKVVDGVSGQGVAGAKLQMVMAGERPHLTGNWTTDQLGRTTLPLPTSSWDELKFWTIVEGYVPAERAVERDLIGAFPKVCTVRLERAAVVGGVVLNEAGEPVAGVEVFIDWGKNSETPDPSAVADTDYNFHYEKTDGKGSWTCRHASKQLQSLRFRLVHPDYVTVMFAPDTAERQQESVASVSEADLLAGTAVVIMKQGLTIKGVVLDSHQKPIEGAEITAGDYPIWTLGDGRFSFNNRPVGETVLTVEAKGFAPQREKFLVSEAMNEVRFELEQGHTLKVRVLDAKGRPVPGARIAAERREDKGVSQWDWETDAEGRLVWDSAPAQEVIYSISHYGYETVRSQPLKADGQEQVITLHKHLQISGHVVDFDAQTPIVAFRVIPGVLHVDHYDWNQGLVTSGQNGTYAVALPKQDLPHVVRVEADGYYPEISRPFQEEQQDAVADFALKRGDPIRGTVLCPDGKPARNAQAALCLEDQMTLLAEARFADLERGNISETDAQGIFLFQPRQGVKMIAVSQAQGYAEVSMDDFKPSHVIRLNPWARITGVLYVGTTPGTNELVQLVRVGSFSPRFQVNSFTALTDSQGRFTFEHVPPGEHIIGRLIDSRFSHGQVIKVASGETTRLVLGEGGRTITGSIVAADGRELDWEVGRHPAFLHARLPPLTIPKLADVLATNAWLRAYWDSEQGRARQISDVQYVLQFESSNVFHAENVPAGTYECEIHYHEPSARDDEADNCLGILRKEVVIPELPPGQHDKPCELGRMTITLKPSAQ
jgi:uncharacterized GH25 family protein